MTHLVEEFDGTDLDTSVWLPHYLPMWSSREATRASYRLEDSCLVLDIPRDQGVWLPEDHSPPLRVSGLQSGNRSGAVGSTDGQQQVYDGQVVREEQEEFRGHLQAGGELSVRCRMTLSPRSMAALWLCGFEDEPDRCGEICVVEVFGKDVVPGQSAEVGLGLKQIRDPGLSAGLRRPAAADRRRRAPRLRRAVGQGGGGLQRRRSGGTPVPGASRLPAAGHGGRLRLPGVEP